MATVSLTWRARNALVHDGATFDPGHIIFEVEKVSYATLYFMYPHDYVQMYLSA